VKLLLSVCLKAVILNFVHAAVAVKLALALADAGTKDLGRGGVHVDE
jgi:hypothetical protein